MPGLLLGLAGAASTVPAAHACATCFGKSDSAMAQGMNAGIFSLLGVITFVLLVFAGFFVHLARRAALTKPTQDEETPTVLSPPLS